MQDSPQGLPLNLEVRKQGLGVSSAWRLVTSDWNARETLIKSKSQILLLNFYT